MLILGGGFAGAYVARLLGGRGATIISRENFMLYTPLLPEAASGTLEPRHTVVPLRVMCPHAELVLGELGTVDLNARTATVDTDAGRQTLGWSELVARARRRPQDGTGARSRGARALVQVAAGRDQSPEPRPATARGRRCGAGRGPPPHAPHVRVRRRRLRGRRGARGALRPLRRRAPLLPDVSAAPRRAGYSSTQRRRSSRRSRGGSASTRHASSWSAASRSMSARRSRR